MKLCVDPPSISTITDCPSIDPFKRSDFGDPTPARLWRAERSAETTVSSALSSSSGVSLPSSSSTNISNRGSHLWPLNHFLSHLKHNPLASRSCFSAIVRRRMGGAPGDKVCPVVAGAGGFGSSGCSGKVAVADGGRGVAVHGLREYAAKADKVSEKLASNSRANVNALDKLSGLRNCNSRFRGDFNPAVNTEINCLSGI
ncbi:hypothetical protein CASFOL_030797 [Castilleja foliolosa]|uniref:Uncharacterized protein n=1 Tax=Castilleja foliolosa TaxID=1961234 RepID=A0ABD3C6C8_9LAMI